MKTTIQQRFAALRDTFFPRWDRARHWKIRHVRDLNGANGQCEAGTKTIRVIYFGDSDESDILLIHEMAHAVAGPYHGKRWQARMERTAKCADNIGRIGLAKLLREEIQNYQSADRVTPTHIYAAIESVVQDNPATTFRETVDSVRQDYGLSRQDFLRRFRRCRQVFDEARRDARDTARLRVATQRGDGA